MRKLRFNIASLLVIILVLGIGFAALRESSDLWESGIFTMTLGILLISILLAVHRSESTRAFWLGFALFGWAYMGLTLMPPVESRLITTKALAYLDSKVPGRPLEMVASRSRQRARDRRAIRFRVPSSPYVAISLPPQQWLVDSGCDDRQAPQRLERLYREFRADRTLAVRSADGLARWTILSPPLSSFETSRSFDGGRGRRKHFVTLHAFMTRTYNPNSPPADPATATTTTSCD